MIEHSCPFFKKNKNKTTTLPCICTIKIPYTTLVFYLLYLRAEKAKMPCSRTPQAQQRVDCYSLLQFRAVEVRLETWLIRHMTWTCVN